MKLHEIMRRGAFTVMETDTLGHAQRAMMRARVRHLPVMSGGRVIGMLSERDVLTARARANGEEPWWSLPVRQAMSMPVQTAGPDDSLTEAAGRMAISKIGALPVVEQGKLIGLVTVTDVLDAEVRTSMAPRQPLTSIAADAMTPYPVTVRPDAFLTEATALMVDRHVRHIPVVDMTSTIVGMLSDRDVRTSVGDPARYTVGKTDTPLQYRVRDVMTKPAVVVPFDKPLAELARQLAQGEHGAYAIVDSFGALIGILSYVDALRVLAQ